MHDSLRQKTALLHLGDPPRQWLANPRHAGHLAEDHRQERVPAGPVRAGPICQVLLRCTLRVQLHQRDQLLNRGGQQAEAGRERSVRARHGRGRNCFPYMGYVVLPFC